MNILMVNKFFYLKGGSEAVFFDTARLFEKNGHKVSFFSVKNKKNLFCEYEKYFIDPVNYEESKLRDKLNAALRLLYSVDAKRKIEELVRREKPDIAHIHNIYHQISPSILHGLKKYDVPIVVTLHDYKMVCASYGMLLDGRPCEACRGGKYYNCFSKRCFKASWLKSALACAEMYLHHKILRIYDLVDTFIAPSRFLKDKLAEMGFRKKIVYLPNFINTGEYAPRYGHEEDSIVYFGRISREKGLDALINAVKGNGKLILKIIGEGPDKERLLSKVEGMGMRNIRFLGYMDRERLKKEIQRSIFAVLPSQCYENNPLGIIEAFALGKPVIGSRIGGIPELIRENDTGFTFEAGNTGDLRMKIESLMSSADDIVRMGKNARAFVEERLQPGTYYEKLMDIYDARCGARKGLKR